MSVPIGDYWRLLASYLRPQRGAVALLAVLLFAGIAAQLGAPLVLRRFIDLATTGAATDRLVRIALLFLAVAIGQQVLAVLATWKSETVGWRATNWLRRDLVEHCLSLDPPFHHRRTPGELIERVDGDVTALANFFSQFVIRILGSALLLAGVLAIVFREDWRLGLLLAVVSALGVAVLNHLRHLTAPHWAAAFDTRGRMSGFVEERLAATEDIRSSGAVAYVMRDLHRYTREIMVRFRKAALTGHHTWFTANMLGSIGFATGLAFGAYLHLRGDATIGTVYMLAFYGGLLAWPLEELNAQLLDLQQATAAISRVRELRAVEPAIRDGRGEPLPDGALEVEFDGLSFAYGDEAVLHDVSFRIPAGETLGLLGRTGSGKTTITRLLFRLYDPQRGAARLGGVDVRDALLEDLRSRVGMVTQEVQLFHGTVAENLTFFDPDVPTERIVDAIEQLGLRPWLDSLPQGLETRMAGSRHLSAGEAQLLALTRVFLMDPGLVILDEPTSRIDPATERLIERAVTRLLRGRTGIVVAHRLGTVARVDSILVLDRGRLREHGRRAALAADPASTFSRLLRTGLEAELA